MKDIVIYGAGGFGREIACLLKRINSQNPTWNLIGFIDDGIETGTPNEYGRILGGVDYLNRIQNSINVVMAIGSPKMVKSIISKITNPHIDFPNIVAPDVVFMDPDNIKLGKGNVFCTGCLLSCNTSIGNFNCFNSYVSIGHDTRIGNFNAFMTATRVSGIVTIGDCNFFGVNCCMVQGVKIGNNTTLAAGSALIRRTKDGYTYIGVPATALIINK